jgi:hypothetical protein
MAKAGKKRSTPGKPPPEANPHFLGRFTPTKLAVPPLYRTQHSGPMTLTPAEARQARSLLTKASLSIPEGLPPPSHRTRKKPDEDMLPQLETYVLKAERAGVTRSEAVRRWVTAHNKGKQLSEKALKAIVARLMRKMRKQEEARARLLPPQTS